MGYPRPAPHAVGVVLGVEVGELGEGNFLHTSIMEGVILTGTKGRRMWIGEYCTLPAQFTPIYRAAINVQDDGIDGMQLLHTRSTAPHPDREAG